MVTISESAQEYLLKLLEKQDVDGMGVRMFVTQPGTRYAETCLAYCRPEEVEANDEVIQLSGFPLYLERNSLPFLEEAYVNYAEEKMGGQLTIKAPNAKLPKISDDSPLQDKINYVLVTEVNPGLAAHGGEVSLVDVVEDNIAILQFGGGCQGCSAVSMTLKDGVEKRLLEAIPELGGVRDVTDHSVTDNAYYK